MNYELMYINNDPKCKNLEDWTLQSFGTSWLLKEEQEYH